MTPPASVLAGVQEALEEAGHKVVIRGATAVPGGCINLGHRLDLENGDHLFLKWNPDAPRGMFAAEADGLEALRRAEAELRVPEPIAVGEAPDSPAWLLLEYLEHGDAGRFGHERLGRALAEVHGSARPGVPYGWTRDNWIGSLPQPNGERASWADFWRDRRIVPQLESARQGGLLSPAAIGRDGDAVLDRLVEVVPKALTGMGTPELLHGDLWSGNAYFSARSEPVVIDPAVYRGDGEVDLAMSELFGGFGPTFYDAYREARPVGPAYVSHRRDLYQLYYLLVHVNLFGASYVQGTLRAASRVVAAVGG